MVYDPRGGRNVHIDKVLTNISLGFPNNGMVGNVLFPTVRVRKQTDLYYEFGREHWLPEDDARAPATAAIEIPGLEVTTDSYFCIERALAIPIADEEKENADSPLDPARDGTELVTQKLLLRREQRIQVKVTTAANFAASHSTTLAGTDQWSDYVNSDPIGDLKTARNQVHSVLFMEPNIGVIPYEVMSQLEDHPDFIERIKYSAPGIITADIVASLLSIPRVVVPGLGYDSSGNPGATPTLAYMWSKDVLVAWVPPRAGLKIPAFGYEFVWRYTNGQVQRVDRWREEARGADLVRVRRRYDLKFIAVDSSGDTQAAYLIKAAVA